MAQIIKMKEGDTVPVVTQRPSNEFTFDGRKMAYDDKIDQYLRTWLSDNGVDQRTAQASYDIMRQLRENPNSIDINSAGGSSWTGLTTGDEKLDSKLQTVNKGNWRRDVRARREAMYQLSQALKGYNATPAEKHVNDYTWNDS